MDATPIINTLLGSGPVGVAACLLLWQNYQDRKERLQFDRERLDTDKKLVIALTALALKITGRLPDDVSS